MKYLIAFVLFSSVFTIIYGENGTCDAIARDLCSTNQAAKGNANLKIEGCNSITTSHKWKRSETALNLFAKNTLKRSYELLGLAINHGSFSRNRPGFEKLFRHLSDESFDNAIKIIKYVSSRGGEVTFNKMETTLTENQFNINEFQSMSVAQTIEKALLEEAQQFDHKSHDPNSLHFIEEEFIESKTEVLRKLTGYVHDLDKMVRTSDSSLNLFMFDEYLQK